MEPNNEMNYDDEEPKPEDINDQRVENPNLYYEGNNPMENPERNEEGEFYEGDEDEYLEELRMRLAQTKNERKAAESDARVMDNRLNLLKVEEDKVLKKIENTKKKRNERLIYLQGVADIKRQKDKVKREREEELQRKIYNNKKLANSLKDSIKMKKEERQKQLIEEAKFLKYKKELGRHMKENYDAQIKNDNITKIQNIKLQKQNARERQQKQERDRKLKLRNDLERQLLEEYRLKEEAEEKKHQCEQQEEEMIKRLKNTTLLHQAGK